MYAHRNVKADVAHVVTYVDGGVILDVIRRASPIVIVSV